jgi:drug/metabolite transporter (DMT)-like permease
MTLIGLAFILVSAIAHATWNFLLKKTTNHELFIWLMITSIGLLFAPLAIFLLIIDPVSGPGWWFIGGTVILHAAYFLALARGYDRADLSLVYPVARGTGPMLVPLLGVLILSETVAPFALVGILTIILGIFIVYWWGRLRVITSDPFRLFRDAGMRYALLTGLVNALQSIWDKIGVRYVNPFLYMYLLALGGAIVLAPYMLRAHSMKAAQAEVLAHSKGIPVAGLLMFLAYGLILLTMQFTQVSYVIPAREVGIVFGVILGSVLLKEPFGGGRIIGSLLIAMGVAFITLA